MSTKGKVGALLGAGLLTFAIAGIAAGGDKTEITICHGTGSNTNPYITETPAVNSNGYPGTVVLAGGHLGHIGPVWFDGIQVAWGDIIPPFSYLAFSYPGMNWDTAGQAIWNNGCKIPVTPGPAILIASKAVEEATAAPGDTLHYTIELANTGGTDATGVAVTDDITALLAHGTFGTCDNSCAHDATSVSWSGLTVTSGGTLDLHFTIVLAATGWDVGTTNLPNTVVVADTNCAANAEVKDPGCSTLTTVTFAPTLTPAPATKAPTFTQPPTDAIGTAGNSGPSDGAWLLVVALGILLGSLVVLAPGRAKTRR